jgi:hypothetical protein
VPSVLSVVKRPSPAPRWFTTDNAEKSEIETADRWSDFVCCLTTDYTDCTDQERKGNCWFQSECSAIRLGLAGGSEHLLAPNPFLRSLRSLRQTALRVHKTGTPIRAIRGQTAFPCSLWFNPTPRGSVARWRAIRAWRWPRTIQRRTRAEPVSALDPWLPPNRPGSAPRLPNNRLYSRIDR